MGEFKAANDELAMRDVFDRKLIELTMVERLEDGTLMGKYEGRVCCEGVTKCDDRLTCKQGMYHEQAVSSREDSEQWWNCEKVVNTKPCVKSSNVYKHAGDYDCVKGDYEGIQSNDDLSVDLKLAQKHAVTKCTQPRNYIMADDGSYKRDGDGNIVYAESRFGNFGHKSYPSRD